MWQDAQAVFLKGEMFKSKFISLPKYFYRGNTGVLKYGRVTGQTRGRYGVPLSDSFIFDEVNFAQDP